jgi:hypothetical protein
MSVMVYDVAKHHLLLCMPAASLFMGTLYCTVVLISLLSRVDTVFNWGGSYHLRW